MCFRGHKKWPIYLFDFSGVEAGGKKVGAENPKIQRLARGTPRDVAALWRHRQVGSDTWKGLRGGGVRGRWAGRARAALRSGGAVSSVLLLRPSRPTTIAFHAHHRVVACCYLLAGPGRLAGGSAGSELSSQLVIDRLAGKVGSLASRSRD